MATKKDARIQKQHDKALQHALTSIHHEFGKGAIMRLGDDPDASVERISTGLPSLDLALGGGLARGRIHEFYGAESSGKSTLALTCVASAQHQGMTCAYIDAENALDPSYAKKIGVDTDDLLLSQPDTGEQGLQICDALVKSGAVGLIVVDSVAALVPKAEVQGEMGNSQVGVQARMMSQGLRKLSNAISETKTIVIFINQLREKVGVMFGNPNTTPGGKALKFYDTIRLSIYPGQKIKSGTNVIGRHCKMKVTKNKVAPPFKRAQIDLYFGKGYSETSDILNLAVGKGIVDKAGAWFSYNGKRLGQGSTNAQKTIKSNPELHRQLEVKVRQAYNMAVPSILEQPISNTQPQPSDSNIKNNTTKNNSPKKTTKKSKSSKSSKK